MVNRSVLDSPNVNQLAVDWGRVWVIENHKAT